MQRYEYNLELQTQYYKIYYFFVFLHFAFSIRVKKRIFAFRKIKPTNMNDFKKIKVAVAGTGYVGMSIATLLAQHHQVKAVDVIAEKVEKINNRISPIQDDYIEKYLEIGRAHV